MALKIKYHLHFWSVYVGHKVILKRPQKFPVESIFSNSGLLNGKKYQAHRMFQCLRTNNQSIIHEKKGETGIKRTSSYKAVVRHSTHRILNIESFWQRLLFARTQKLNSCNYVSQTLFSRFCC